MLRRACLVCCLALTAACGGETRSPPPLECFPANVELSQPFRDFENQAETVPWYASGDSTGSRVQIPPAPCDTGTGGSSPFDPASTPATESYGRVPIEGGPCGSTGALLLTSSGHNDWGAVFGDYDLINTRPSGADWDGLALWARTGRASDRSFTLLLDTPQTTVEGGHCKEYCNDEAMQTFTDPNTGQIVTEGDVDPPDACGNSFRRTLMTTDRWQLYLLPFASFDQEAQPNRAPEGMDTSAIMRIVVRPDKGATLELYLDEIGFYRRK